MRRCLIAFAVLFCTAAAPAYADLDGFGMTFDEGYGRAANFGISTYFGYDDDVYLIVGMSFNLLWGHYDTTNAYQQPINLYGMTDFAIGASLGWAKMYEMHYGDKIGWFIQGHAGYISISESVTPLLFENLYIGAETGMLVQYNDFLFRLSVYADTSWNIAGKVGLGFLLD